MDGRHETLLDAELFVDDLDQGREAIGSARGTRNDVHGGLVVLLVDTDDDGRRLGILRGCRNNDLLRTTLNVFHAALRGSESSCRLANILNASILPWNLSWVTRGREGDWEAVDDEPIVGKLDGVALTAEAAVDGVVLEQVLH